MIVQHCPTLSVNSALDPYLRVTLSSGNLTAAGAAVQELGTLEQRVLAADSVAAIVPRQKSGTRKMVAAAAITQYARVFGAAGGKISSTANGNYLGYALEAASGDGSIIEVFTIDNSGTTRTVEAKTADFDIEVEDSGKIFTSVGAAGTVVGTLPAAVPGLEYFFRVGAAQELRVDPDGTETIALPSTGVQGAAGKYLTANANGETVAIKCDNAGEWSVYGFTGTWTAEA